MFAQYEVEQDQRVWVRALLDVRLVRAGPATSWTDSGPGKLRYGGKATASGFERTTRLALSQLAIEVRAALPWDIRAQAQVNFEHDLADNTEPWLIEAILRKEWGAARNGFGLQTGVMNVPVTREVGHAVTLAYQYQLRLRHRIAAEYIWLESRREASGLSNPTPDGWQLSYRYRY